MNFSSMLATSIKLSYNFDKVRELIDLIKSMVKITIIYLQINSLIWPRGIILHLTVINIKMTFFKNITLHTTAAMALG